MVLATGGSIVSEPETFDLLLSTCHIMWLKAKPEEHMARVVAQGDQRPMAGNTEAMEDLKRILAGRELCTARPISSTPGKTIGQSFVGLLALGEHEQDAATTRIARESLPGTVRPHPDRYAHWRLTFDGPVATLAMDVDEDGGLRPGLQAQAQLYDLGVDIELHDALQRIRFEHPEVRAVVITSAQGAHVLLGRQHLHARRCRATPGR